MVLTLGSGAALARTSNMISAAKGPADDGFYYCLETDTEYNGEGVYDLGLYPSQNVYKYPADMTYRTGPGSSVVKVYMDNANGVGAGGAIAIDGEEMCNQGGVFFADGREVQIGQGMLVSLTAISSLGVDVNIINVMDT